MDSGRSRATMRWLPALLIAWNVLDIAIHVVVDMVEPLRIAGNIVCLVVAAMALLGILRSRQAVISGSAAVAVVVLNTIHAAAHGYVVPMLVFVGVSVLLLLLMTQTALRRALTSATDGDAATDGNSAYSATPPVYLRRWVSLPVTVVGVAVVALVGSPVGSPLS